MSYIIPITQHAPLNGGGEKFNDDLRAEMERIARHLSEKRLDLPADMMRVIDEKFWDLVN
jgi:hypothetical protein